MLNKDTTQKISVRLMIVSEEETSIVETDLVTAKKIKKLLCHGIDNDCYPEKVNALLDKCKKIKVFGTVNTMGDGWGWYESEEDERTE